MSDQARLPRFKKPPVSEVALGVQFPAILTPVHLGLYYEKVKSRFPKLQILPPVIPVFETFGPNVPPVTQFGFPNPMQSRMWFLSENDNYLIQLQADKLIVNWRSGPNAAPYPHFETVQSTFTEALDHLESLVPLENLNANQCEVVYVNPILTATTAIPLSEPQRIFRVCTAERGPEWQEPLENVSYNARYQLKDDGGTPYGRLTVSLASGIADNQSPASQLELTARGAPRPPTAKVSAIFITTAMKQLSDALPR